MQETHTAYFKAFARVSKAIHQGESSSEILDTIVVSLRELFRAKGAIYWIVNDEKQVIESKISDGFSYRNLSSVDYRVLATLFPEGEEAPVHIADASNDVRIPDVDAIGKRSVGTIIGESSTIVDRSRGVLAVYFYSSRELTSDEKILLKSLAEQGAVALRNAFRHNTQTLEHLRQIVEGFTLALEAKDEVTHGHSVRVAEFAKMVAKEMLLPAAEAESIYHGALLHDIGKIGMGDEILEKLGILSKKERGTIQQHPVIGARIITPLGFLQEVVPLVLHHHERFDGSGYPAGLKGDNIPLGARIISACDALETMLGGRKHIRAMTLSDALVNLHQGAGAQFDPEVINCLFTVIEQFPEKFGTSNGSPGNLQSLRKRLKHQDITPPGIFI